MLHHMKRRGVEILFALFVLLVEVASPHIFMSFNQCSGKTSREVDWTLTRDVILSLRSAAAKPDQRACRRIRSLGCEGRRRGCRAGRLKVKPTQQSRIPVVVGRRRRCRPVVNLLPTDRRRVLATVRRVQQQPSETTATRGETASPTLYVLNAAAITKPHAIQHLTADLIGYSVDIAVISETHLKRKHPDNQFAVHGYTMFRRDRAGRRGGGVAVYINRQLQAATWTHANDSPAFELLWIRVQTGLREIVLGALYHPPKALYQPVELLDYIEECTGEIADQFPTALIVLAGDFNTLPEDDIIARCAFNPIVTKATRGASKLDRIYVSEPYFANVKVVASKKVK